MESEFITNLKQTSLETILIAILVFSLTMLIKWPIKKFTAKFDDNKRKAINTVIVFIPMILSLIFNGLYFGIFKSVWFDTIVFDSMTTSYLLAVSVYAVFTRIVILVKGGITINNNDELSKETIKYIKSNITILSKALKLDEKNLTNVVSEIENLLEIRNSIIFNTSFQDLPTTEKLNNELNELEQKKEMLTSSISKTQTQIKELKETLNKKGEI